MKSEDYARGIALAGLKINAIKLNPDNPFTWASGYRMPIYNDNRMFLEDADNRNLIARGFINIIQEQGIKWRIIAGTSTAGISPATTLADITTSPLIYVRDKAKDHGLRNQIEGIDAEKDLEGKNVILIEDLVSTGGSSVRAVQAIRNANGVCNYCLSIFNYGFETAKKMFQGEEPFDKEGNRLNPHCTLISILTYDTLLNTAKRMKYINEQQEKMLAEWRTDPFGWGEKHSFPKVAKD